MKIKILKFGGSSLANSACIQRVGDIVLKEVEKNHIVVVASALQNVTNELLLCAASAAAGEKKYLDQYEGLRERHHQIIDQLALNVKDEIDARFEELQTILQGVYLLHECPPRSLDAIASFGELLSSQLLANFLTKKRPALFVDARQLIVTDDQYTQANVLFADTNAAIRHYFLPALKEQAFLSVVTGFIGATRAKQTTTIGRNGSDYSAAIFGAALQAEVIEIWTDVDGIFTADPRIVKKSTIIPHLSYEEAMELSHFGAKVLHPASIVPAIKNKVPILIKNTFNPRAPGTLINHEPPVDLATKNLIKGISSIDRIALLTLRGMNMVGTPGTAERLFRSLAKRGINIILISQASSEHTICFAINMNEVEGAENAITQEFQLEFDNQLIKLEKKLDQTIIAVVGDNMIGTPGIAGKFCFALGENKVNINAIAQGASERNISLAINTTQAILAMNAVHQFFFESHKKLALCLVGVGNVGAALLALIKQQSPFLLEKGYDVNVVAIADSKKILLSQDGIDLNNWQTALIDATLSFSLENLQKSIAAMQLTHVALVDCTASSDIVAYYPTLINDNFHIITPNKKANVLPWDEYQAMIQLLKKRQRHFLFEANVGAGLPIISTLNDLINGGDTIIRIEGIFSGTLSYLFNRYQGELPFSEIIKEAHAAGYTEPDPREDLSGSDVARKLLILARLLGRKMEFSDIGIADLVPEHLRAGKFSNDFYQQLTEQDETMKRLLEKAKKNHCVLRYVGTLDEQGARAELKEVPYDHPLAQVKNNDNIIAFTTQRYFNSPLVVQGPGAGATVTAMGVFSDIVKLLHYLPY